MCYVIINLYFLNADVEGCFQALFSTMYTLGETNNETSEIISAIVTALVSDLKMKPALRLRILVILFNLVFLGPSKYQVLNGD